MTNRWHVPSKDPREEHWIATSKEAGIMKEAVAIPAAEATWRAVLWFPEDDAAGRRTLIEICGHFGAPAAAPTVETGVYRQLLADALLHGKLVALRRPIKLSGAPAPPPVPPPPPAPPAKKSWIKLLMVDDVAGTPLGGVTVNVTLTDGSKADYTSKLDGMIAIDGIDPGTCDATDKMKGLQLDGALQFAGKGAAAAGKKDPDDEPVPKDKTYKVLTITEYKVKKGDTLASIAGKNGLTADDLALFNFGSAAPDAVQKAMYVRVGSRTKSADKKTVVFDDADKPGILYIPKDLEVDALATEQTHPLRARKITPRYLAITRCDDHFAPGVEKLDVAYTLGGLAKKKVKIEITSKQYAGPIYERDLTDDEKKDGDHQLSWDGKATTTKGDLKGHFLNPLYAPYKVHIFVDAKYTDEVEFKVLYHSLKIMKGAQTPDEKEPTDPKAWAQYKLNELGYYGGPVGKDTEKYLERAVIRYKANHKKLHQLKYADYTSVLSPTLKAALKANENRRDYLGEAAFSSPAAQSNILVEALTYEDGEFGADRYTKEKTRLNRPLIPVEVDVYLKSKADAPVLAREAVGPVRVNWRWSDADEDLTPLPTSSAAEPSKTDVYLKKSLQLKGGRAGKGDNVAVELGGVRGPDGWKLAMLVGDFYIPYKVEEDAGQKVVFSKGCVDKGKDGKSEKRIGKVGVYFRPSAMAGDDYKLKAEIDFTGLPNKADLEKLHNVTDEQSRIHVETGTFHIRRFNQVAVVIDWPARTNAEQWPEIQTEFVKALLDVDIGHITRKKITDVLTPAQYKAIVKKNTAHTTNIALDPDAIVGVPLPAQGALNAAAYRLALDAYVNAGFWDKINADMQVQLSKNLRKDHPVGFTIVNFLTHKPVSIQTAPPLNVTVTPANTGVVLWTFSIGLPDSTVFADQKDPDKVYYVVSHEMGHNFWLHHWENAGGKAPGEHDTNDHNCIMAYSSNSSGFPNQVPGVYTPHFCGKCNTRLRGWDILSPTALASS